MKEKFMEEPECPMVEHIMDRMLGMDAAIVLSPDQDLINDFLKELGYKILQRINEDGEEYWVAFKENDEEIPDWDNTLMIAKRELWKTVFNWILKIKEQDGGTGSSTSEMGSSN